MNITAIIMVIISALFIAYQVIQKEVRHCKNLDIIVRLLSVINNKALYYDQPFADIVFDIKNDEIYKHLPLVDVFCNSVDSGFSVPEAWRTALCSMSGALNSEEFDTLSQYGEEMCRCNKEDISDVASRTLAEFQDYRKKGAEKRNQHSKITAAVTVSVGAIIVLVFI